VAAGDWGGECDPGGEFVCDLPIGTHSPDTDHHPGHHPGQGNEGQLVTLPPNNSDFLNASGDVGRLMGGGSNNLVNNLRTGYIDDQQMPEFTTLMQNTFQNTQLQQGDYYRKSLRVRSEFAPNIVEMLLTLTNSGYYVYIDTSDAHGLMIVGWGPIEACAQVALGNVSVILGATYSMTQPVPWVADFTRAQNQIPRPFYCTWFDDAYRSNLTIAGFGSHDWYFFRLKDSTTFAPSQLWVDPNWSW
jgi:hypothetical protein